MSSQLYLYNPNSQIFLKGLLNVLSEQQGGAPAEQKCVVKTLTYNFDFYSIINLNT